MLNPRLITALAVLAAAGCAHKGGPDRKEAYETREKAYGLIDQSEALDAQGSRLLALERLNRSTLIHESPKGWYEQGRQFQAAGKNEQAAAAYRRALELAPDYQEAEFSLVALGYQPGETAPASETLTAARQWAAENPVTPIVETAPVSESGAPGMTEEQRQAARRVALATAAQNRLPTVGEVKTVVFAQAPAEAPLPSALDPTFPTDQDVILGSNAYHARKADQMRRRGDFDKALEEYNRALDADSTVLQTRLDIGDMLMKLERQQDARFHYETARDQFPESPRPRVKLGTYYMALNQIPKARDEFHAAIEKDSANMQAWNNLAVIAMREKDFKAAAEILDNMIKLDPTYANAHYNRAIIAEDVEKNVPLALEHYNKYLDLDGPLAPDVRKYVQSLQQKQARPAPRTPAAPRGRAR